MSNAEQAWKEWCEGTPPVVWGTDAEKMFKYGYARGRADAMEMPDVMAEIEESKPQELKDMDLFHAMYGSTWGDIERDMAIYQKTKKPTKLMIDAQNFLALAKHCREQHSKFIDALTGEGGGV